LLVSCSSGAYNGVSLVDLTYMEAQSFTVVSEFRVAVASRTDNWPTATTTISADTS